MIETDDGGGGRPGKAFARSEVNGTKKPNRKKGYANDNIRNGQPGKARTEKKKQKQVTKLQCNNGQRERKNGTYRPSSFEHHVIYSKVAQKQRI